MGDWNSLRDNPVGNFLFGSTPKAQPGVGNVSTTALQKDPSTGMYFDPSNGTTFMDANGTVPVTDPNVAQQVAQNFTASRQFLTRLGNVQGQEGQLAGNLQSLLTGGAPSMAQSQVQQGMNNIAQQQMSNAAGVSGPGGPLAQLLASRNTANAQIQANAAGGIARADELTGARNSLAQLLGGMGSQDLQAGGTLAGLAASGQGAQQGLDAQTAQQNQDFMAKLAGTAASTYAGGAGAKGAGGG